MYKKARQSDRIATNELAPGIVERQLATLNVVLKRPVTELRLDRWVKDSLVREDILSDTVWGTIRWRKSLGLPIGATPTDAFIIEHISWQWIRKQELGASRWIQLPIPHPQPSKWNGPNDAEYFRVSFKTETLQRETSIRVTFAPGITWERRIHITGRAYHDIQPPSINFLKGAKRQVLEPFEVVTKPYPLLTR